MTSRRDDSKAETDIELSDVGLLDQHENGSNSHSWYSAHGRGYSVNGRQSETQGGTSHIGTVLGERYYSRERCSFMQSCIRACHRISGDSQV